MSIDHKIYFAKSYSLSIVSLISMFFLCSCWNLPDGSEPTMGMCYIDGQVYNLSHAGPVPVGWTPPPLTQISTIRLLNNNKDFLEEHLTFSDGSFSYAVNPGTYYVSVKESPVHFETGPITLGRKGDAVNVKVYYDNGMR